MTTRHWLDQFWGRASRRPMRPRKPSQTRARLHCEEFEPRTLLSIATHFSVVPSADYVQPGVPFSVTVTAEDDAGHPADYLGPVHFTSQDPQATLPANYTFTAADHGVHTFSGVIIRTFRIGATQDISAGTGLGFISEFVPATGQSSPEGITAGPDGNLWFTENFGSKIGRITPQGAITEFPVPSAGPHGITAGPDGNLWYTTDYVNTGNHVGRITPTGTVTEFQLPTNSATYGITAGPDGNLWFTELAGKVGRITPAGTITEFFVNGNPQGITRGPDGNLWFVDPLLQRVGKITPSGVVTAYQLAQFSDPQEITAGPDGNLWFTERGSGTHGTVPSQVAQITPAGAYTEFLVGGSLYSGDNDRPIGITAGPDGYLWFTEQGANRIGRINGTGIPNFYSIPTGSSQPYEITRGPDGNLWFTESDFNASRVGRINLVPTAGIAVVHGADSFVMTTTAGNPDVAGTPFSVTVTAYDIPRHIDTGYHNTVHFASSDPAATLPANYTFTAADNGVHTFSGFILRTAGSPSVTAADSVNSHGSATVNVVAAAASRLVVSTSAAIPDVAGTPFNVTVTARDAYGNTATGYTGTVHFSSADPYGASLPADYTFQPSDQGVHTFAAGATLFTAGTTAVAYANGFGDPSQITANGNTTFPGTPPVLRLTDGGGGEYSSAWYHRPVGLGAFTTTFTLQDQPVTFAGDGLCFVLQADPRGLTAQGGSEGYGGIVNSIAVKFDLFTHGYNTPSTGLFTGGAAPDGDPTRDVPLTGINLGSGDPIQVTLSYDGTGTLTETVTDTLTQATFTHAYAGNVAQVIGTNVAYAGFTGSSGAETAIQDIVSWTGSFHSGWDVTATDTVTGIAGTANVTVQAAPAAQFVVSTDAASPDIAGTAFDVTVVATDPYGNTDTNYTRTVTFSSADPYGASLPADYTFQASDQGVATFSGVTALYTAGTWDVTATDTTSGITGAAFVNVQAAPAVAF